MPRSGVNLLATGQDVYRTMDGSSTESKSTWSTLGYVGCAVLGLTMGAALLEFNAPGGESTAQLYSVASSAALRTHSALRHPAGLRLGSQGLAAEGPGAISGVSRGHAQRPPTNEYEHNMNPMSFDWQSKVQAARNWTPIVLASSLFGVALGLLSTRMKSSSGANETLQPMDLQTPFAHTPKLAMMTTAAKQDTYPEFELPTLPWGKGDLAPHISEQTIDFHYGKHHQAYVNKLNELVQDPKNAQWKAKTLEQIMAGAKGPIFNQAAQIWNHNFFWNCLRPNPSSETNVPPEGKLLELINRDFGSFGEFKSKFTAECVGHFGSGWVFLVLDGNGCLKITQGHDASNPISSAEGTPLLTCDVWEHAYYLDKQNGRPAYVESWWHLVNWDFVGDNLVAGLEKPTISKTTLVPLSPLEDVLLGGFAGTVNCMIGMPLLTLKFCLQSGQPLPPGILGWYRGVLVQTGSAAPIAAFQMLANGMMSKIVSGAGPFAAKMKRRLNSTERMVAALAAGVLSAVIYTPVDLLTIQQQRLGLTLSGCFSYVVQEHGFQGLLHGVVAMSLREGIFSLGMFGLTPIIAEALMKKFKGKESMAMVSQIVGSTIAGVIAALLTHPMDTIKTCLQSDMHGKVYKNIWQTFSLLVDERGFASLFGGMAPRMLMVIICFFVTSLLRNAAISYKTMLVTRAELDKERLSDAPNKQAPIPSIMPQG